MKTSKLKLSVVLFLFGIGFCNSQAYYPSLNNLFIDKETESVFNEETEFFRLGLRKFFKKLFYSDLQTSNGGNQNNYTAFYSMKIIPRFVFETDFFDEEIKLKFDVSNDKSKYPALPVIFNEYYFNNGNEKMGKGDVTINKGTISLLFLNKAFYSISKSPSEFLIEKMNYEFKNNIFEIVLKGQLAEDIKIKKNKIDKDSYHFIKIIVKNNRFLMFLHSDKTEIKITEKTFSKDDFKD